MGNLDAIPQNLIAKILNAGDSGAGKTGALGCLAENYRLVICDFDNGTQILYDPSIVKPEWRENIYIARFLDPWSATPTGPVIHGVPTAFSNWLNFLHTGFYRGKTAEESFELGPCKSWGPDTILVNDSLTFIGYAALAFVQATTGRLGETPSVREWGVAIKKEEDVLSLLFSDAITCHCITNCHFTYVADPEADKNILIRGEKGKEMVTDLTPTKPYPSALGNKLPPKVGRFFNTVVLTETSGHQRVIQTKHSPRLELKTPCPSKIPPTLPVGSGLKKVIEAISGTTK